MDSIISEDSLSLSDKPEEETFGKTKTLKDKILRKILNYIQQVIMILCWLTFTYFLMVNKESEYKPITLAIPSGPEGLKYTLKKDVYDSSLYLRLYGAFIMNTFKFDELKSSRYDKRYLAVQLQQLDESDMVINNKSILHLYLADQKLKEQIRMTMIEKIIEDVNKENSNYQLHFFSNINETLPLQLAFGFTMVSKKSGLILGLILLVLIYIAIMFDLVHRTLAGIICSTMAVGLIAAIHMRPSLEVIFNEWGNIDIIMQFFGISIIMEMLAETGLQDYLAAVSYELSHGHIWPMLHFIMLSSCLLTNLFDGMLLVLFIAPICLRLCEIMELNCTPILSCLIIAINLGSTLTPISSISNSSLLPHGHIEFFQYIVHMLPATFITLVQSYLHLRIQFHNSDKMRNFDPFEIRRLKRLITVWRRASLQMGDYTWDDSLARQTVDRRIFSLRKRLKRLGKMPPKPHDFEEKLQHLRNNFPIRQYHLLTICLLSLIITSILSLANKIPQFLPVSKGWISILSALLALSLSNYHDIEGILARLDWSTMLFFVTLSIVMQVLISLGLLEAIGLLLEHFIVTASEPNRLMVAIVAVIWISAFLATFIDNVPVADMMMRIIGTLSLNQQLNLPLMPLVWSLVLGCALGGNGSIVGALANIACAGVASRHGYRLTFFGYFKIGFFVMLGNIVVTSCYLLVAHVIFQWH